MTGEREHDGSDDDVRVHAALEAVSKSGERPVGDNTRDANLAGLVGENVGASNQVFDSDGVEQLDIWELKVGRKTGRERRNRCISLGGGRCGLRETVAMATRALSRSARQPYVSQPFSLLVPARIAETSKKERM